MPPNQTMPGICWERPRVVAVSVGVPTTTHPFASNPKSLEPCASTLKHQPTPRRAQNRWETRTTASEALVLHGGNGVPLVGITIHGGGDCKQKDHLHDNVAAKHHHDHHLRSACSLVRQSLPAKTIDMKEIYI